MDYSHRLAISYYKTIAAINEPHKIFLVQHQESQKIYVKKILDVYNLHIYQYLQHNHFSGIPNIIDFFEENNQLVLIEEYISGCSLQEKIETSDLTLESIIHYMSDLCKILEQLHTANPPIVHRDIKPSNIIITKYNRVVLLDFNASKYYTNNTSDTVLLGTAGYAAPEQYGFGSSSPLTDIYSLGILLKELTSVLPNVPSRVTDVITKCTQINPTERFNSVSALNDAFLRLYRPAEPSAKKLSFLPPGFRTKTPWKIFISSIVYLFLIWLCSSIEITDTYGITLWIERIFCFLMMLSVVFCASNYLDIRRLIPLCKHKYRIVRYLGIVLLNFLLIFALFIIMFIVEAIFLL